MPVEQTHELLADHAGRTQDPDLELPGAADFHCTHLSSSKEASLQGRTNEKPAGLVWPAGSDSSFVFFRSRAHSDQRPPESLDSLSSVGFRRAREHSPEV
jgi:hypothetical protein